MTVGHCLQLLFHHFKAVLHVNYYNLHVINNFLFLKIMSHHFVLNAFQYDIINLCLSFFVMHCYFA
jgi:hypothetical protein